MLKFYQIPPAGNPVSLLSDKACPAPAIFEQDKLQFYASGTAALASALIAALHISDKIDESCIAEVIMPAYSCPDLVSAAEFAGIKPVLVDLEIDSPWIDLTQVVSKITKNTIAIVAVNLFGIEERWPQLCDVANQHGIILIEDNAQYFPGGEEELECHGEFTVFSFGRGKPVSLLGGGAVYSKNTDLYEMLPKRSCRNKSLVSSFIQEFLFGMKARIYNMMLSPYLYWFPLSLPFLHLGETRYHALDSIEAIDDVRVRALKCNIIRYRSDKQSEENCKKIMRMAETLGNIINLPKICGATSTRRLLRYPLLVDAAERNDIYHELKAAGLGVSVMYPSSLPEIPGISHMVGSDSTFPNAQRFAARIITLPTHSHVSDSDIDKMKSILK